LFSSSSRSKECFASAALEAAGNRDYTLVTTQIESYRYWQEQLKRTDFVHGQFGENFTIEGLADNGPTALAIRQHHPFAAEVRRRMLALYRFERHTREDCRAGLRMRVN
jgi:hypothetical protein